MEQTKDIIQSFMPLLTVAVLAITTYFSYGKVMEKFWKESKANEWMIIIRGGEMLKSGIGLASWLMPGDQAITFPSQINQVNFSAQQVSAEMQGVEVSGMIIWSVYR